MRAVDTVERIRQRHPNQVVAIFSHGDVIRTTVAHYLGIPIDLFQRVLISTASISAIAFHGAVARVLFTNHQSQLPKFEFKQEEAPEKAHDATHDESGNHDGKPTSPPIL